MRRLGRRFFDTNRLSCSSTDNEIRTMELLMEVREQNKCLRLQVETLRQKLGDAQADIKVLRASNQSNVEHNTQLAPDVHQREEMIEQLEIMNIKVNCCVKFHVFPHFFH